MRTSLVVGSVWLSLLLMGCDDDPPEPATETTETTGAATEPEEAPTEAEAPAEIAAPEAKPRPARPTAQQLADIRLAALEVREGRGLARRDEWAMAIPHFTRAVTLADSARARCELGWAHYQVHAHAQARTHLERGVAMLRARARRDESERGTLGACLYNLGRVTEESDPAAAALHYRESLAVRPGNRTVQSRLDGLDAPAPTAPRCAPRRCEGPVAGDAEAALASAVASHYGTASADVNLDGQALETGFLFQGAEPEEGVGDLFLALHDDAGWYACRICEDGDYGAPRVEWTEVTRRQWVAGGAPELDFAVTESWHGREEGIANEMGTTNRWFAGFTPDGPVVYGHVTTMEYDYDGHWVGCDDCGPDDIYFECCREPELTENESRWRLVSTGSGRIRVDPVEGGQGREVALTDLACDAPDD